MKLDIGCGKNKKEGFIGVDQYAMEGVDHVVKVGAAIWDFGKSCLVGDIQTVEKKTNFGSTGCMIEQVWTLPDDSVEEAHSSHFLEHLTNFNGKWERVHFFNELHRVLKPGGKATIIIPHWNSNRYYGDPTHKEPISEMAMYYLSKEWRKSQAPHSDSEWNPNGYTCDFEAVWGNGMHPQLMVRAQDFQQFAMQWYKEAIQDLHITLTKK